MARFEFMRDITLQDLLEAGCHFGHKSERWHPKAQQFIYTEKDGIHIIDLAKTKIGIDEAITFVKSWLLRAANFCLLRPSAKQKGL